MSEILLDSKLVSVRVQHTRSQLENYQSEEFPSNISIG